VSITFEAARVNKNLSQKEGTKLIGISLDTLVNYEKGKSIGNKITLLRAGEQFARRINSR